MTQRRIRTTSQHEQIIPGPAFPAQQVADAITTAQTEEKVHPAEVHCRIEVAGDGRPQLVVFYVQETTQ